MSRSSGEGRGAEKARRGGLGIVERPPSPSFRNGRVAAREKCSRNDVPTPFRRRKAVDTPGVSQDNSRLLSAEGYPSGQRGQTVNLLVNTFEGSNPSPSTTLSGGEG